MVWFKRVDDLYFSDFMDITGNNLSLISKWKQWSMLCGWYLNHNIFLPIHFFIYTYFYGRIVVFLNLFPILFVWLSLYNSLEDNVFLLIHCFITLSPLPHFYRFCISPVSKVCSLSSKHTYAPVRASGTMKSIVNL